MAGGQRKHHEERQQRIGNQRADCDAERVIAEHQRQAQSQVEHRFKNHRHRDNPVPPRHLHEHIGRVAERDGKKTRKQHHISDVQYFGTVEVQPRFQDRRGQETGAHQRSGAEENVDLRSDQHVAAQLLVFAAQVETRGGRPHGFGELPGEVLEKLRNPGAELIDRHRRNAGADSQHHPVGPEDHQCRDAHQIAEDAEVGDAAEGGHAQSAEGEADTRNLPPDRRRHHDVAEQVVRAGEHRDRQQRTAEAERQPDAGQFKELVQDDHPVPPVDFVHAGQDLGADAGRENHRAADSEHPEHGAVVTGIALRQPENRFEVDCEQRGNGQQRQCDAEVAGQYRREDPVEREQPFRGVDSFGGIFLHGTPEAEFQQHRIAENRP